jgi:hypothetical protein
MSDRTASVMSQRDCQPAESPEAFKQASKRRMLMVIGSSRLVMCSHDSSGRA